MSGQISLTNVINEKDAQPKTVERQSLPKSTNAFALLMAKSHADHQHSSVKAASKTVESKAEKAASKPVDDDSDAQAKKVKKSDKQNALDDVLPQLSAKDTPLKVSKSDASKLDSTDVGSGDATASDLVSQNSEPSAPITQDPVSPDLTVQNIDSSTVIASNVDGTDLNPQTTDANVTSSSTESTATDLTATPAVSEATGDQAADANPVLNTPTEAKADSSAVSSDVAKASGTAIQQTVVGQANTNTGAPQVSGQQPPGQPAQASATTVGVSNNQQNAGATVAANASQNNENIAGDDASPASNQSANTASNVTADKVQSGIAAQLSGSPSASAATTTNSVQAPASTSVTSTSTSVDTSSSASQAGQQNAGQQSFSQNGQGSPSSQNSFMNQLFQSQQVAAQQSAVRQFSEQSISAGTTSADTTSLLGNLGLDTKAQLPASLQGIAYSLRSPQWGQALGQRLVYMASNKIQEAKITLNPEKLGPVQIKLHMDKNQQLHVSMSAHHHMTKETMEAAVPKLREMLDSTGIDLGSIDVNQDNQFDAPQQNNEQGQEKGNVFGQSIAVEQSEQDAQPVVVKQTNSLIDYYA